MNGTDHPPGLGDFFRATVGKIRGNLEIFLLVSLLWAVVATATAWPFLEELNQIQQLAQQQNQEEIGAIFSRIAAPALGLGLLSLLVYSGIYVVWVRAAAFGRAHALAAGFARRYGLVLWRSIALVGYGLLILIGAMLLALLLTTVFGVVAGGGAGAGAVNALVMLAVLAAGIPVYLAYSFAVAASACDRPHAIIESLKALQGLWWPYIAAALTGYLVFALSGAGAATLTGSGESALTVGSIAVSNLFNGLAVHYVFAAGATAFEAVRAGDDAPAGPAAD